MDVIHAECDEAGSSLVYMVTNTKNELLSFDPATAVFRRIGVLACPGSTGTKPFSMAVDRFGIASVLYDDGRLYRVDTATADCDVTSYRVGQHGLFTFGMGYASLDDAGTEALFVASDEGDKTSGKYGRLGKIDMSTLSLTPIGTFNPSVVRAELTGSGGGDLFAFHAPEGNALSPDSFISRVDKHTANVLATDRLAGIRQGQGWAVAFWGGDLYLFTCPAATPPVGSTCDRSRVTRFRPSDKSLTQVGGLYPGVIVGAGVSTCAPH